METCLQDEKVHMIPTSKHSWQQHKINKKYNFKLREMRRGDIFGHEEILQNFALRKTRVISQTISSLLYIDKDVFLKVYLESELLKMQETMLKLNAKFFCRQIEEVRCAFKQQKKALLDSTKVHVEHVAPTRISEPPKVQKIKFWLQNLKNTGITNERILMTR